MDAIEKFRQTIAAAGLTPPDVIHGDGKLHRYSTDGKPSHKNGWYFLHLDGIPWGQAGSWDVNGGEPVSHWCEKSDMAMTQAERDTQRQRSAAMKAQQNADKEAVHKVAAMTAAQRLAATAICTQHDYLTRKGIQPHGARFEGDKLLIPMRDTAGKVHSLQTIAPDGAKMFMSGGRVKGCYFGIGRPKGALIVCEGFATGASIHECTGHAVAVAFNSGNLEAVAVALRDKFPTLKIIIAADDDHQTPGNPGMTKATAAVQATGAALAVPVFKAAAA